MRRMPEGGKYRLGVGTWRPAILTGADIVAVKVVFSVLALIRAADYAYDAATNTRDVVEQSLPALGWAGLCATVAALLIGGMAARIHWAVFAGHFLGSVVYLSLSVGALQHALTLNPPDDWRRAGALFGIAFVHWTLAKRSGPTPMTECRERPVEQVVAPPAG